MEFHEKLQELRKQKGMTQEELARQLYVSRAAVSKWESGRGYPGIDSLKAIASCFSTTVDALLSSDEILTIAHDSQKNVKTHFCDLVFGMIDLSMALLLFLPVFAARSSGILRNAALFTLDGISGYLLVLYFAVILGTALSGLLILALQNCTHAVWVKSKIKLSLALGCIASLLFTVSLQPYAAVFAFALLSIKTIVLIKRR